MKTCQSDSVPRDVTDSEAADFAQLLEGPVDSTASTTAIATSVLIGTLAGFAADGVTPLVCYAEHPGTAAVPARTTVELYGVHIGREVVLTFDRGDVQRPIIIGYLRDPPVQSAPVDGHCEISVDDQRLVISAKERIVLRCGKASITLTKDGKVVVQGAYVSNQSSGVLRLKGGSVQIN